jgi:hypothetical protein
MTTTRTMETWLYNHYREDYYELEHLFERWGEWHLPDFDTSAGPSVPDTDFDEEIFQRLGQLNVKGS